jgi:hypothetical protein
MTTSESKYFRLLKELFFNRAQTFSLIVKVSFIGIFP